MTPIKIALILAGTVVGIGFLIGHPLILLPLAFLVAGIGYLNAWETDDFRRAYESSGPVAVDDGPDAPRMDVTEELLDLVRSATQLAVRRLEDEGAPLGPFVLLEDGHGSVRIRRLSVERWEDGGARAREAARALGPATERVVAVYEDWVTLPRSRRQTAIVMEAAERGWRPRTVRFAQPYRRKGFLRPVSTIDRLRFLGEAPHTLLIPEPAAAGSR